jgi:hypothetical protein
MGLDNSLSIYKKRVELNNDIIEKLKTKDIYLRGYDGDSFRGKAYNMITDTICNESLFGILYPSTLGDMSVKITNFLNLVTTLDFTDEIDVRDYIKDYNDSHDDDLYKITKKELISLRDLFQFCEENNLYLHPDF